MREGNQLGFTSQPTVSEIDHLKSLILWAESQRSHLCEDCTAKIVEEISKYYNR